MWTTIIVLVSLGAAPYEIYIYPDVYEHGDGLGAAVNEEALAKLIDDNSVDGDGDAGTPQVWHKIDLNNDGKAEIFLAPTQVASSHATGSTSLRRRTGDTIRSEAARMGFHCASLRMVMREY